MTTIKEIAKLAGVSAVTVSNVLNGKGGASEGKVRQIKELAERLHYTPNRFAKNLKQKRSSTIGVITEDLTVFNTPEIVDGIDACCEKNGFDIILGNLRLFKRYHNDFTDTPKHRSLLEDMVRSMYARQVEGIIYIGYHCRNIDFMVTEPKTPLVYAYCFSTAGKAPSVIYDDEKAAYDATDFLIRSGHSRIGVLCGPLDSFHTQERLRGYQQALFDHHLLYDNRIAVYGNWERSSGYRLGQRLIESGVRAIFSMNDIMACGVYDCCAEQGLAVGRDVSLIGFDNQPISEAYHPQLTTISIPLTEIGNKAAELMVERIAGKENKASLIKIPCQLVLRESVAQIDSKIV